MISFSKLRSRSSTEITRQITPPTKNGHAPPPAESRKSEQSVNPQCLDLVSFPVLRRIEPQVGWLVGWLCVWLWLCVVVAVAVVVVVRVCVCACVRVCAVRCGAVRCGAVRCGAVRCGAVRCGAVRCGAVP